MGPRPRNTATVRARGRRPAGEDTRTAIVEAARSSFAAKGYDGTSLRGVARDAGVDPALVHHYFDGKVDLLTATLDVPVDFVAVIRGVVAGGPERLGWRIVETFLSVWEDPGRRESLLALVRSGMTSEEVARIMREFLSREVFSRVAASVGASGPQLRGELVGSQLMGLVVMRYLIRTPAAVAATPEQIVERLGPVIQYHLMDTLAPSGVEFTI